MKNIKIYTFCSFCGEEFTRYKNKTKTYFCNIDCKAKWQCNQKPVTKEWLYQKYVVEGLGCPEIAKIVKRDPKRVYDWLIDLKIPTRSRGSDIRQQWKPGQESAFKGRRHTESTKEIFRQTQLKHCNLPHLNGKPHYLTVGDRKPASWKGGITPERQTFYRHKEWIDAVKIIWKRDNAVCQRCGKKHNSKKHRGTFHIHHIISFMNKKERANPDNLVLLCRQCHLWIHSNKNINKELINE